MKIGYLEFDDQGELWRAYSDEDVKQGYVGTAGKGTTQLPAIIEEIRRLTNNGPIRTMIFIHGWNNNASETNGNLHDFKDALRVFSRSSADPVFGVYVSWRGRVLPVSTYVDVGSREAAASRVGRGPLLSCLRAISVASRSDADLPKRSKSRVIAIGHSFGAKILAQVTSNHLGAQLGYKYGRGADGEFTPLADTTILANTAESAIIPRHLIGMMRDYGVVYQNKGNQRDLPLVASISATSDGPVRNLLPAWNLLARGLGLPSKSGALSSGRQRHASHNAMGFEGTIQSHTLYRGESRAAGGKIDWDKEVDWAPLVRESFALGAADPGPWPNVLELKLATGADLKVKENFSLRYLDESDPHAKRYRRGGPPNDTPFWAIQVPEFVVSGHNGLWNPNFLSLIAGIEAMGQPPSLSRSLESNKAAVSVD